MVGGCWIDPNAAASNQLKPAAGRRPSYQREALEAENSDGLEGAVDSDGLIEATVGAELADGRNGNIDGVGVGAAAWAGLISKGGAASGRGGADQLGVFALEGVADELEDGVGVAG